jgi:SAM-dependent methyltransferase
MHTMPNDSRPRQQGPGEIEGIKRLAPELDGADGDYPPDAFAKLVELEQNNFWFRSRNRIISRIFRKYVVSPPRARVLEIGCGTGFVLNALRAQGRFQLVGAEQHVAGLIHAKRRLPDIEFIQLDARRLPYRGEFDAIGAFDVLEHIEEDEEVIASARSALRPGGHFVITVPQHAWLWSSVDEDARHKRRYSRQDLTTKLERNGFRLRFLSSFVFTLLPLMFAVRALRGDRKIDGVATPAVGAELALPRILDRTLELLMRSDEGLIAAGVSLPVGGSLLAVAQRG